MEANRGVPRQKVRFPAWLALYLLAPFFGEVVSGSTTPIELVNVAGAIMLAFLYGGGALLIREAKVRLNKGWSFVFLWGCAYGILEEGLCCKSFFDPHWPDIDKLGIYGRSIGVNWVWVFFLILFHACVSMMLPIFLAERIYHDKAGDQWTNKRGSIIAFVLMMLTVVVGYCFFPDGKHVYLPPWQLVTATVAVISAILALSLRMPPLMRTPSVIVKPKAQSFLGFVSYTLFVVCMFGFPNSVFSPWQAVAISSALFALLYGLIQRSWSENDESRSSSAFLKGLFISFSLWCVLVDMKAGFTTGSVFVPIALFLLIRRTKTLTKNSKIA